MDRVGASPSRLGEHLAGRYRLVRLIGNDLYEADDERLQRRVVVQLHAGADDHEAAGVLDAGRHQGSPFVVLPLADASVPGTVAVGDDEPTQELETKRDDTMVLPVPLLPADEPEDPDPSRVLPAISSTSGWVWRHRALLVVAAGVVVVALLVGLTNGSGDPAVPVGTSAPVTIESTTTVAPTTTSPPTTEQPAPAKGKGKGKKGG